MKKTAASKSAKKQPAKKKSAKTEPVKKKAIKTKAAVKPATKKVAKSSAGKAAPRKAAKGKKTAIKAPTKKAAKKRPAAAKARPAKVKAKSVKATPRKTVKAKAPKAQLPQRVAAPVAPQPKWPPLVEALLAKLDDAKAEQIVTIDLAGKSTVADTMVVASGRSNRHVDAIAKQAIEELEKRGVKNIRSEGMPQCDWVLVDAGDILLHVFRPEVRSFYNLEKLWSAHAP